MPDDLIEGESVILRIGKYVGVGTVRKKGDAAVSIRAKELTREQFKLHEATPSREDVISGQ